MVIYFYLFLFISLIVIDFSLYFIVIESEAMDSRDNFLLMDKKHNK